MIEAVLRERWRSALDRAAASTELVYAWTEPPLPEFDGESTCLYVVDEARDIALRAEHSVAEDFSVSVSSRDAERRLGQISDVGAWMQLSADMTASDRHERFVFAALQVFLVAISLDLDVRSAELMVNTVANGFYNQTRAVKASPIDN